MLRLKLKSGIEAQFRTLSGLSSAASWLTGYQRFPIYRNSLRRQIDQWVQENDPGPLPGPLPVPIDFTANPDFPPRVLDLSNPFWEIIYRSPGSWFLQRLHRYFQWSLAFDAEMATVRPCLDREHFEFQMRVWEDWLTRYLNWCLYDLSRVKNDPLLTYKGRVEMTLLPDLEVIREGNASYTVVSRRGRRHLCPSSTDIHDVARHSRSLIHLADEFGTTQEVLQKDIRKLKAIQELAQFA